MGPQGDHGATAVPPATPDILLAHGYFLGEDEKEQQIMRPYPPLGLMYLSAFLSRADFRVELFDSTLRTRAELHDRLARGTPSVLGLYTNLITRPSVLAIAERAKQHGWTVVLGGPESANYPAEYLAAGVDAIVIGEGELTLVELLPALRDAGPHRLHGIAGVVFRDERGAVIENRPREQIADLDALPWPDRSAIDMHGYMQLWRTHHGASSATMITARGCPYRCRWCSHAVFGFTHRRRSVRDCADELEFIRDVWHPDQIWYADDVFAIHPGWLFAYGAELKRRGIRMPFETISRADRLLRDEVVATLAEMGCFRIWIGSESGSQRILDAMSRGVTVAQVQQACRIARAHGISTGMFLMWGYEGETLADIEATVEHVATALPDVYLTTLAYPIKGTPYFEAVADRVSLDRPWREASDRDYRIAGRRDREYYRHADRWMQHRVAAARSEAVDPVAAARHHEAARAARAALFAASPGTP
ncbi:MAG TPA: radical SAM protein [Vicinamibacterales bacterium]